MAFCSAYCLTGKVGIGLGRRQYPTPTPTPTPHRHPRPPLQRPSKWGWVSTQPGSSLQLTLNTFKPGAGPEERVTLGVAHLKSYEASSGVGGGGGGICSRCFVGCRHLQMSLAYRVCGVAARAELAAPAMRTQWGRPWCQGTSTIQPQADVLPVPLRPAPALQHMGKFSVACVEGCACDLLIADGHGTEKWSQLNFAMLLVTPAGGYSCPACQGGVQAR